MKEKKKHRYTWLWVLVLLAVLYLGFQVWRASNRPYRTQTAVAVTLTDGIDVNGIVVREERPILQEIPGVLGYTVQNGERIAGGSEVAYVFGSVGEADCFDEAGRMQKQKELLEQAQYDGKNAGTDVSSILRQVDSALYEYITRLESGDLSGIDDTADHLGYVLNKLDIAVGREDGFENRLSAIEEQCQTLQQRGVSCGAVYAPQTGFFSDSADGLEHLTAQMLEEMTPEQLRGLSAEKAALQNDTAGKVITSYQWDFCFAADADQASRFTEGQRVTLDFTDAGVTDLPAAVAFVGESGADGSRVIRLHCERMEKGVTDLRFESVQVRFATYTGIRISRDALHVNADGEIGVYIKFGSLVQFRRITPIFETEVSVLTPLTSDEGDAVNEVSLYDEIIIEGSDLFDGKLL